MIPAEQVTDSTLTIKQVALTAGRDFVAPEDVREQAPDVLAHRMVISGDEVGHAYVQGVLERVPLR